MEFLKSLILYCLPSCRLGILLQKMNPFTWQSCIFYREKIKNKRLTTEIVKICVMERKLRKDKQHEVYVYSQSGTQWSCN